MNLKQSALSLSQSPMRSTMLWSLKEAKHADCYLNEK